MVRNMNEESVAEEAQPDAPLITDDTVYPLWFAELMPGGGGSGFLEKTNRHSLMFVRRPRPVLLVSFDNLSNVNDGSHLRGPWAYKFARDHQVSHLGIIAHSADWYRDPALIARMQGLAGEGFFEGYDRVVFAGSSMGAFGALVFSSLVPGAHVLAFNPQSTLDAALVPWETRFWAGRRQDWGLPLSDAGALLGRAGRVSVFYDAYFEPDRKHFERLEGDNVTGYKCWFSNHKSAVFLRKIDALKPLMTAGLLGDVSEEMFYRLYRERRRLPWYVGTLSAYFVERGRVGKAEQARAAFRRSKMKNKQAAA